MAEEGSDNFPYGWCHNCFTFQLRQDCVVTKVRWPSVPPFYEHACISCGPSSVWGADVWDAQKWIDEDGLYTMEEIESRCRDRVNAYPRWLRYHGKKAEAVPELVSPRYIREGRGDARRDSDPMSDEHDTAGIVPQYGFDIADLPCRCRVCGMHSEPRQLGAVPAGWAKDGRYYLCPDHKEDGS